MLTDRVDFFLKFVKQPGKIGSITPSSGVLAHRLMNSLPWESIRSVVELGAGTGVFTKYIDDRRRADCSVLVFEQNPEMRESLMNRFPHFYYGEKAETLRRTLQDLELEQVDCVISGLPLAVFPDTTRKRLIGQINKSLAPGGLLIAFQYSPLLTGLFKGFFSEVRVEFVLKNMPPAFIYRCRK
jgi:phospholipid N-methyltransferase